MANPALDCITADFLEKILRKSEKDDTIRVSKISTKPATNKGDNYTSDMYRVVAELSHVRNGRKVNEKSVIVKIAPQDGVRISLVKDSKIFDTEITMMLEPLTRMNELLGPPHRLSARCLYYQLQDPVLLVLEDLAPLGFRMVDRQAGLDWDHCVLALKNLANFHASSVALCEREPKWKTTFVNGIFRKNAVPQLAAFFSRGTKALGEEVANWPELGPRYSEKILKLADVAYERGVKAAECREGEFNVITHGDFWVNNMLFRHDDKGRPIDHIFVDFQMCAYTTPVVDLQYFLYTGPTQELFEEKAKLLEEYHKMLCSTMARLGCKTAPPTFETLKKTMEDREDYGMIAVFTVLPILLVDKDKAQSLDELMNNKEEYNNSGYKCSIYRKVMTKLLPYYEAKGMLD
ncbi:uncharacterized protein LOC105698804 [Orussus abietinus]|uniref:uncharacterized protein LOC105698804 n=1 Tax=Orussus abietinus TaxID=222816 RepID=UPI000625D3CB|nr:uncharacterized protein LOC105698804 [Orussus abietinus]XP_012278799.1 uncharacterized protein LOC105698804 [Orussus abietinus]